MKQKVVIKVSMGDHEKCRSKALKIAVSFSGVESVALQGLEKDQILVIGDIDAVSLATLLRKKVGHSEILSVGAVDQKKKEEKKDATVNKNEVTMVTPLYYTMYPYGSTHYSVYDIVPNHEPSCSIM
ncbi:hypothetical protein LguiB_001338 [Lonicera macranthoides]